MENDSAQLIMTDKNLQTRAGKIAFYLGFSVALPFALLWGMVKITWLFVRMVWIYIRFRDQIHAMQRAKRLGQKRNWLAEDASIRMEAVNRLFSLN
jgi:hypothetical protein